MALPDAVARPTMTLPPVGGGGEPAQPNRTVQFSTIGEKGRRPGAPPHKIQAEAKQRREFLGGFLNQDLEELSKWHAARPAHEQRRFLKSVNMLYKAHDNVNQDAASAVQTQMQAQARAQAQREAMALMMPAPIDEEPASAITPRGLGCSQSAPDLAQTMPAKPIDVFEQRKRERRQKAGSNPLQEDPNTLEMWMEAQSMASGTTGTTTASRQTSLSQLTKTSSGGTISLCSEPCTMAQASYRIHKRAFQANRSNRANVLQQQAGCLKDGLPTSGFPESERMKTQFREAYGTKQLGETIVKGMYANIVKPEQHPFVEKFLDNAPMEQRQQFGSMIRSLQTKRKEALLKHRTRTSLELDLAENRRLFHPAKQRAVRDTIMLNMSQVPLGNLYKDLHLEPRLPETPPPPSPVPPYSPSVSNLGSLPLSPRSMSTPLVGGKDLPLAVAPQAVGPLAKALAGAN
mmetsp:Transcript_17760/g.41189  ORF Transcript_17760/g.41189 Transcript_17760/m.41189 type:complete len:460 (+) Transcript_17760:82-1461(+)